MIPRVVGSPQAKRLFAAKSIEALTVSERRRSGVQISPPATPSTPPRLSTEAEWADSLSVPSNDARRQCGLPVLSAAPEQLQAMSPAPRSVSSDSDVTVQEELTSAPRKSLWRRILEAFRCLRGR